MKEVKALHHNNEILTFIDLFAGIGGIRKGFEDKNTKAVFSSEWDKFAQKTYEANYGEMPAGDITAIHESEIPAHDVLLAGFPCNPLAILENEKDSSMRLKVLYSSMC